MAWVSPTGEVLNGWSGAGLAWDDDTLTFSYHSTPSGWGPYIELTHVAINCDKVQGWWDIVNTQVTIVEVDVYYNTTWNNIYSGAIVTGSFQEYAIGSTQSVTAMRVRFYSTKANRQVEVYEADFWEVGITPGWNKIQYTSEPPTSSAWNQIKRDAGTGWKKILYDGE